MKYQPGLDVGNAKLFARLHSMNLRYCPGRGWLAWNDRCWTVDTGAVVHKAGEEVIANMYEQAEQATDAQKAQAIRASAVRLQNAGPFSAMLNMAKLHAALQIQPEVLDTKPMLLTVTNGTIDLTTGHLRRASRAELITRLAPVTYEKAARYPRWLQFLGEVTAGDEALQTYLQRIAGYCLTGDTREQCFFVLYGSGSNGKSVFVTTLQTILGPYAAQTSSDTFLLRKGNNHGTVTNDLARLAGVRIAVTSETEDNRTLSESLVKQVTGTEPVTARYLYQENFEFKPQFKLLMNTNYTPRIRGNSWGIRRRVRLVPFTVTIPDDKADRMLQSKLLAESSGILNWALEGCLAWQQSGLAAPEAAQIATSNYLCDEDLVGRFLAEKCSLLPEATIGVGYLYNMFAEWAGTEGERLPKRMFGKQLRNRGFQQSHDGRGRVWRGLTTARLAPACTN